MSDRSPLPLPRLLETLDAWQVRRGEPQRRRVAAALADLARTVGLRGAAFEIHVPPLADLSVACGSLADGAAADGREMRGPDGIVLGRFRADPWGDAMGEAAAGAVAAAVTASRSRVRAERAEANLAALDAAVRGITGVHGVDAVLQLIVDRVRELVDARYAALRIVEADGLPGRFVTGGISAAQRRRIGAEPSARGLLGEIVRRNRSLRIADVTADRRHTGFPPHHPPMRSFLGVPIRAGTATIGQLYLTDKQGTGEFSEDDQLLVERFALHAGIAVRNARLHERVQRLAVVEERERIGRDLHDGIIQRIYGVTLSLDDLPEQIGPRDAEAAGRVDSAIEALHAVIGQLRTFIFGLGPQLDERDGLLESLEALAQEVSSNVPVTVRVLGPAPLDVPASAATELVSIAREALSNVARHADAGAASITISTLEGGLRMEIADDGGGFEVAGQRSTEHRGLGNMRKRALLVGGRLSIASGPDGTRVTVRLP